MFKRGLPGTIGLIVLVAALVGACAPQQTAPGTPTGQTPTAASAGPHRGGTLRLGVDGEPGGLDPIKVPGNQFLRYSRLFFNNLLNSDANGRLVPGLAESWSTQDNKTFVFKLRKGVKFQDGTDFNADAVKFTLDRATGPEAIASRRGYLSAAGLTSYEVVDDYTIKFNLKAANAAFPAYLVDGGTPAIVSPTGVKKWGDKFMTQPVGTGPFELVEWVTGDHMTVKRFENYWRKDDKGNQLPYVDQIIIRPIPDESVRFLALRSGDLDLVDYVGPSDAATVQADAGLRPVIWGTQRLSLVLNTNQPPFDNKAIREALAWAVDREAIHKSIYGGTGSPAQSMLDPNNWAFDPQGKFYTRDLAKAKAKLAEGGKPNGFKFEAKNYNTPLDLRVSQAIKAQLAEAGINMEIIPVERQQQSEVLSSGKFEAAFTMGYGLTADPDIELTKVLSSKGANNFGKYANPEVDSLLAKAQQAVDQAERKALYAKLQTLYLAESPQIFIHHNTTTTAMSKAVQGFVPGAALHDILLDWLWIQK